MPAPAPEPSQVETPLDRRFFRPLAQLVAQIAVPTPLGAGGMRLVSLAFGLSGASLLRYPLATQLVSGAVLLVIYAVLDRAAGELAHARGATSRIGRIHGGLSNALVGVVSGVAIAVHMADERPDGGALVAVVGLGSALLQATLGDHFTRHYLARTGEGGGDEIAETEAEIGRGGTGATLFLLRAYALLLRVQRALGWTREREAPTPEVAAAHARRLGPVAQGWGMLGPSTHAAVMAVFVCAGGLSAYVWLRLTLGNVALVGLYVAQHLLERALDPPAPVVGAAPEAPPDPLSAPPPAPPTPERDAQAPISFRPPPLDE